MNIAIDGPAGAGKSTIAKKVAKELGFIYVDTGAMYRSIAVYLIDSNINPEDVAMVKDGIKDITIQIKYENNAQQVYLNDVNVTGRLRTETVGNMASKSSALPCVREKLLSLQRDLAREFDVVMDGRDIGTNILPDAELKVYLTASADVRARRRYDELMAKGEKDIDLEKIKSDIVARDKQDMERETAPLKQADDAVLVDSSNMGIDEVANRIISLARARM
ncbi:MAG: (d)CMP kinase [Coprococcus sp.]|nr:(d)CMP kinase [Coprococcus sp.]